jgi:ribonuclease III
MPRRKPDIGALQARIGHVFNDPDLLVNALTHVSAAKGIQQRSYQRMEFLGDRVLGLAIADMLYSAFKGSEGDLSRRLSELVRRETCSQVAEEWGLGPYIKIGGRAGQLRSNRSVLADVCESVIAAVFMDAGYPAAKKVVEKTFGPRMQALRKAPSNPKAALQEWALARGLPLPLYEIVEQFGPHHMPQFRIAVTVKGFKPAEGTGPSKRAAEQDAAETLLVRERWWRKPLKPLSRSEAPTEESVEPPWSETADDVRAGS